VNSLRTKISFAQVDYKMKSKSDVLIEFGNRVRDYRKRNGMSQEELADKAKLHRTYIGMIERAEKNITLLNIEKIAKALNVNLNTLFDEFKNK
jgi:transcriptional regulator with XRE-family HTH domain